MRSGRNLHEPCLQTTLYACKLLLHILLLSTCICTLFLTFFIIDHSSPAIWFPAVPDASVITDVTPSWLKCMRIGREAVLSLRNWRPFCLAGIMLLHLPWFWCIVEQINLHGSSCYYMYQEMDEVMTPAEILNRKPGDFGQIFTISIINIFIMMNLNLGFIWELVIAV